MNDLLSKLLPGAATILGGPIAGLAVGWLSDKLGVDKKDTQAVVDAIGGLDPTKRLELEASINQWAVSEYDKMTLALMADVSDARARDSKIITAGSHNYRADVMFVLAVCLVSGMIYIVWRDPALNEYAKGIFTLALGRFLGYLDNIYNFEFGTTRANKAKDVTIANLTKGD